jgi:hypothetical protein
MTIASTLSIVTLDEMTQRRMHTVPSMVIRSLQDDMGVPV